MTALFSVLVSIHVLEAQPQTIKKLSRGARPTPRHRLVAAVPYRSQGTTPNQIAYVPSKLSMWLNDIDGDCVTAEEAFAKACTGIFITDATVKSWASKNRVLNGADIDQVLKLMQSAGFSQDSNSYNNGAHASVDYSNEAVLQNALVQGPVKLGIDADALPSTAGNQTGWLAIGGTAGQFSNEDHCISLAGFGTAQWLYTQIHVPLPSTIQPSQPGYLAYTWDTLGFVDHAWIMSTCGEAWVRNPTTVIVGKGIPNPDPSLNPITPPIPPVPVPPNPPTPTPSPNVITLTPGLYLVPAPQPSNRLPSEDASSFNEALDSIQAQLSKMRNHVLDLQKTVNKEP